MNPTPEQAIEMLRRLERNRKREPVTAPPDEGDDRESKVRTRITEWCDRQWPPWLVCTARTDKPSTLPVGFPDMVIFGPHPTCIIVETKSKSGKPSSDQRIWEKKFEMLGWRVHFVKTFDTFITINPDANKKETHG